MLTKVVEDVGFDCPRAGELDFDVDVVSKRIRPGPDAFAGDHFTGLAIGTEDDRYGYPEAEETFGAKRGPDVPNSCQPYDPTHEI